MKAKDTVMGQREMIEKGGSWGIKQAKVAEAQAEISFKAGIKEVVDFVHQFGIQGAIYGAWQAKLKEWE